MTPQLIEKLQKILALTTSPVEGEAQAATFKLQELLTQHNLDIADLEKRGAVAAPGIVDHHHDLGKAAFAWKLDLADMVAGHFYCHSLTGRYGRWSGDKEVKFIGRPDNVEALTMIYKWLIDQIKAISAQARRDHYVRTNEHIDPLRWQVSFGVGVVDRLGDRLEELMKRKQQAAAKESAGALVIHHEAEISDYLEKHHGYRTDGRETAKEKARREEREADAKLKQDDPEAYYRKFPWERPLTPEQQAERDKKAAAEAKRQARNDRRRERNAEKRGYSGRRSYASVDWTAVDQKSTARSAGREAAKDINLEPFLKGGKPTVQPGKARLR
jgi:hypothetical protein